MKLGALFQNIPILESRHWNPHLKIQKITSDSRNIEPGDIFVACPGSRMDGHDFLGQAIVAKASAIIFEKPPEMRIPRSVVAIRVRDSQAVFASLLNRFYDYPDKKIKLVGITGTNGKTTVAYLLHQLLREKIPTAYLGTLWYDVQGEKKTALNTTPGAEVLIPLLAEMVSEGIEYCIMEVSSHALEQRRVHGLGYELAIFTQLSQDHLDYHKTMEEYFRSKRQLFEGNPRPRKMLTNQDCPYGRNLKEQFPEARVYSLKDAADYQAVEIEPSFRGSHFKLSLGARTIPFQIKLPLSHNVANVVTALAALDLLGFDPEDFKASLQEIAGIPGRMESVSTAEPFQVFVDYAHTPDAIENVLSEAKKLHPKRVLTLFGCGGDRDQAKRPMMAQAACRYSDIVVLTSDNPRSEDPEKIIEETRKGTQDKAFRSVEVHTILDRKEAIEKLLSLAEPEDIVFILGKGHENYQILGEAKIPFDDRKIVKDCLRKADRVFFS